MGSSTPTRLSGSYSLRRPVVSWPNGRSSIGRASLWIGAAQLKSLGNCRIGKFTVVHDRVSPDHRPGVRA
jgi:hypothetical protein